MFLSTLRSPCLTDPYNWNFDEGLTGLLTSPCDVTTGAAITFDGNLPIFTTNDFLLGSSMSHLDTNCGGTTADFLMHFETPPGTLRRVITDDEAHILCDLGYSISGQYGAPGSLNEVTGLVACDNRFAGADDSFKCCSEQRFSLSKCDCDVLTIDALQDLACNDYPDGSVIDVIGVELILPSTGEISLSPGATMGTYDVEFVDVDFSVVNPILIRYVPVFASGQLGNITYVQVFASECVNLASCSIASCNIICNGSFELIAPAPLNCNDNEMNNIGTTNACVSGWGSMHGTPGILSSDEGQPSGENVLFLAGITSTQEA